MPSALLAESEQPQATPAAGAITPGAVSGNAPLSNISSFFGDGRLQQKLQERVDERLHQRRAEEGLSSSLTPGPTPQSGKLPLSATDFPQGASRVVPEATAKRMAHGSAAKEAQLLAMFNQVLDAIEPQTRRNNVAAAIAFAMAASEQVLAGNTALDPERYGALVVQINDDLGDTEEFKTLADRRKQEIYESSLLTAGLIVGAYRQSTQRHDATLERQARTAAIDYLREMGGPAAIPQTPKAK